MEIYQVPLGADDLEGAVAWWSANLGARHLATFAPAGLAFVQVGSTRVMFERGGTKGRCYLRVDDVDALVLQLERRGVLVTSPVSVIFDDASGIFGEPAAEHLAMVADSEGNSVGLMTRRAQNAT